MRVRNELRIIPARLRCWPMKSRSQRKLTNARKCLAAGFLHVLLVSTDEGKRSRLAAAVASETSLAAIHILDVEGVASFLDALLPNDPPADTTVRGYKVRVNRQAQSPESSAARRNALGKIVGR